MMEHRHCGYCGRGFSTEAWPRRCEGCGQTTFRNPIPVAVLVVPVGAGVLVIRRNIPPTGRLALPGGYVDFGESWQAAAARELREETGVVVDAGGVKLARVTSSSDGASMIVFGIAPPLDDLGPFAPNSEVLELLVVTSPIELAFSSHTEVLRDWFAGVYRAA